MLKKITEIFIVPMCCIFTTLMIFFGVTMLVAGLETRAFLPSDLLSIGGISALFAILTLIFRIKGLSFYVKLGVHFVLSSAAIYFVLFITGNTESVGTLAQMRVFALVFYMVIYVAVAAVIICVKVAKSNKNSLPDAGVKKTK